MNPSNYCGICYISSIINKFEISFTDQESINARDKDGNTPLHLAILSHYNQTVIELLLQRNPDINVQNNQGNTPLHLAARSKDEEAVKLLLNKKAEINIKNNSNDMLRTLPQEMQLQTVD